LIEGKISEEIGKNLATNPGTADIRRANLLRKYSVDGTTDLIERLLTA